MPLKVNMNLACISKEHCSLCKNVTQIKRVKEIDWKAISIALGTLVLLLVTGIILKK
jgi:hypothetical protein